MRSKTTLGLVGALGVGASLMVAPAATAAPESESSTQMHPITCGWVDGGVPRKITSTAIEGLVVLSCSDRLDNANTTAQLQIDEEPNAAIPDYRDFGAGVTSYSTSAVIRVADTAGARAGTHYYRVKGEHFGQHHNIFVQPTYYSDEAGLTR